MGLKIKLNSIMVDDQSKALAFYTNVLGFAKGKNIEVGGGFRWITVVAPEGGHRIRSRRHSGGA